MMTAGRLANWLGRVPATAARLELRYESLSGAQALLSYTRSELEQVAYPADAILESAQEHTDATRARVSFVCVWVDDQGRTLLSKSIRCDPENDNDEEIDNMPGSGTAPRELATMDGLVAQLMRHVENRERMLNLALGTNLKLMHDQLRDARHEADGLRGELRIERAKRLELERGSDDDDVEDEETRARAAAFDKITDAVVTQLVPLAAAKLRGVV